MLFNTYRQVYIAVEISKDRDLCFMIIAYLVNTARIINTCYIIVRMVKKARLLYIRAVLVSNLKGVGNTKKPSWCETAKLSIPIWLVEEKFVCPTMLADIARASNIEFNLFTFDNNLSVWVTIRKAIKNGQVFITKFNTYFP